MPTAWFLDLAILVLELQEKNQQRLQPPIFDNQELKKLIGTLGKEELNHKKWSPCVAQLAQRPSLQVTELESTGRRITSPPGPWARAFV